MGIIIMHSGLGKGYMEAGQINARKGKLVVIGCGMAGGKFVERMVHLNSGIYDMTIIGNEQEGNYNRVKLVYKLMDENVDGFILQDREWFNENGVEALFGSAAISIDKNKKTVYLDDGKSVAYDKLVLATGSHPIIPITKGYALPRVLSLRTLRDVECAKIFLEGRKDVLVIGGGLLGLELALALKRMGKNVTVAHLLDSLMEMQLCPEAGRMLQKKLEHRGLKFIMSNSVTELAGDYDGVERAVFKDGTTVNTEAVFFSCGIRPNVALAKSIEARINKGIVVNDRLETSVENVYAIGECAEHNGKVYGLVAPVWEQARKLAHILNGEDAVYTGSDLPPTKLKCDIQVITMGRSAEEPDDEVTQFVDNGSLVFKKLLVKNGRLEGVNVIGDDFNIDSISIHYTAKLPLPEKRANLLFPSAKSGSDLLNASDWPDDTPICDCNGVSAGKIRGAIKSGCDTLSKIMLSTKAGTGCGNCKNKIKAIIVGELGELKDDPAERYYVPGIPMSREELTAYIMKYEIRSVSNLFRALPHASDDSKTRMGLDYLLNYIWKGRYEVEDDSRCANDRYYGNIQNDGRFSVIPHIPGGLATSGQLRAIADVADEFRTAIKITGADRIGLYAVDKKDLKAVWDKLQAVSGHAFTKCFRQCKACVGSTYCRFGLADSLGLGERMSNRYRGTMGPAKFKMGVSGCPRNCSEATIKDFGVVAVEGGYDLYVGGNGGSQVFVAKKLARVKTEEEIIAICDRFYEYYRKNAKYGERSCHFIERAGFETVTNAILYDDDASLQSLENDFRETLGNYRDPWSAFDGKRSEVRTATAAETETSITIPAGDEPEPGSARLFKTPAGAIAVFRTRDGRLIAADNECPHKKGPIVDSIFGDGKLTCPLHNYAFDAVTGECSNPEIGRLRLYATERVAGRLVIKLRERGNQET